MRLLHINIHGFKSYGNKVQIRDLDPEFNAITGLNGSGKSNVLDSICFVLGLKSLAQLRVSKIDDLVYKSGQSGVKKASVELIFDNSDKRKSPHGYDGHDTISVNRDVQVGGRDRFTINGKLVKNKQVKELFLSISLNVNNPHFLVMQGRITKVISMKPMETLSMLEEAAGTMIYETKRKESEMKMALKDKDLREVEELLSQEISPQLEKMVEDREKHQKWCRIGRDMQVFEKLLKMVLHRERSYVLENQVKELESIGSKIKDSIESEKRLQETKAYLAESAQDGQDLDNMEQALATMKKKTEAAKEAFREVRIEYENEEDKMKKLNTASADVENELKALNTSRHTMEESHKDEINTLEEFRRNIEEDKMNLSRKEAQLHDLRLGNATTFNSSGEKVSLKDAINDKKSELSSLKNHIKDLCASIKNESAELAQLPTEQNENDQYAMTLKRYKEQKKEVDEVQEKLNKLNFNESQYLESVDLRNKLQEDIKIVQKDREEFLRSLPNNVRSLIDRALLPGELAKNIFSEDDHIDELVFGPGIGLMRVKDGFQEYRTALEQICQMKLFYSVVADDTVAEKLFQASRRTKQRITCIPLNRIKPSNPISSSVMVSARKIGEVHHPMDIIIPKSARFEPALRYIFGNVLVCKDSKTAREICEKLNVSVVTIRGDSYNTTGNISGGSSAGLDDIMKYYETFGGYVDKQRDLEASVAKNSAFLSQCNRLKVLYTDTNNYLTTLQRKLETTQSILDISKLSSSACRREALTNTLREKKLKLESKYTELNTLQSEVTEMERTYKETTSNMDKTIKLIQKEVPQFKKDIKSKEKQLADIEIKNSSFMTRARELEDSISEKMRVYEEMKVEMSTLTETLSAIKTDVANKKSLMNNLQAEYKAAEKQRSKQVNLKENFERKLKEIDGEIVNMCKTLHQLESKSKELAESVKQTSEALAHGKKEAPYVTDEPSIVYPDYNPKTHNSSTISKQLAKWEDEKNEIGRKFSSAVLQKFEDVENRHQDILARRNAVQKEKKSIQEFIEELDQQKKNEIHECYKLVATYFRDLFETLLPGASCQLKPTDPKQKNSPPDMYRDGLSIQVAFHGVWKQSLDELSGGQRSLIALSFILALLKYKPAPMYILDEVDAALDLSHTQNIGKLIKNHFTGSQFLVISLKPNLFKNANAVYQTKLVSGVSQISRTSTMTAMAGSKLQTKRARHETDENRI